MAYKLVIADIVEVPVKFTTNDGGKTASFSFHLQAKRLPQAEFKTLVEETDGRTVAEFLAEQIVGWRAQRLVIDEHGEPAAYGPEALECMFSLVGLPGIVLASYIEACGAKGKEKN
jgi:hypothetical protein